MQSVLITIAHTVRWYILLLQLYALYYSTSPESHQELSEPFCPIHRR